MNYDHAQVELLHYFSIYSSLFVTSENKFSLFISKDILDNPTKSWKLQDFPQIFGKFSFTLLFPVICEI